MQSAYMLNNINAFKTLENLITLNKCHEHLPIDWLTIELLG